MNYKERNQALEGLIHNTNDSIAVLANSCALIYDMLPDVNWVGFYIYKNNSLVLGPFQGKPACVHIPMGKGACGTSAQLKQTVVLEDVSKVENYIACHSETNSEIVIPIIINNEIYAVLDIDSLSKNRFQEQEQLALQESANIIARHLL